MLLVLLAILAATAAGVVTERRLGDDIERVTGVLVTLVVRGLAPFVIFFVAARLDFSDGVGVGLVLAYAELTIVGLTAYLIAAHVVRLPPPAVGSVVLCTILVNTGYLGTPLIAALLGTGEIHAAIAYDALVSNLVLYTAGFAVGAALGTRAGDTPRQRVRAFFTRNPVLYAAAAGLVVPDALAPRVMVDVAETIAIGVLPLGFFLLGANLVHEDHERGGPRMPAFSRPVALVIVLRLAVAPLLLLALSALTVGVPDAYLLQAAMPAGINALIVGHVYGLDNRVAAAAIAWSTVVAVLAALALSLVL